MKYRIPAGIVTIAAAQKIEGDAALERLSVDGPTICVDLRDLNFDAAIDTLKSMRKHVDGLIVAGVEGVTSSTLGLISLSLIRLVNDVARDHRIKSARENDAAESIADFDAEASNESDVIHPTSTGAGSIDSSSQQSSEAMTEEMNDNAEQEEHPVADEVDRPRQRRRRRSA